MEICERFEGCPFYQGRMRVDQAIGAMFKKRYCETNKEGCARYLVANTLGPEFVTNQLFPNMMSQAEKIIKENKK